MKKFKCKYRESETIKEIEAESSEEAYKAFLDQEGIKPDYVYVSGGGLLSKTDTYEGHFDQNAIWDEEAKKAFAKKEKQVEEKQAAESSLSSTDMLLKELIVQQTLANETLKKVRKSLLVIHIIMVLWFVFGWVIKPI